MQLYIFIIIFFLFNLQDSFNTNLVGVVYLLSLSAYSFMFDLDVYAGFLIIIDLGVFFIMFTFIISLSKFLVNKLNLNLNLTFGYTSVIIFLVVFLFNFYLYNVDFNYTKNIENIWFFYLNYYNYYEINSTLLISEMGVLKEIYFNNNYFEFFLISIVVYFAIFSSFFLFNFLSKFSINNILNFNNFMKNNKNNSSYFFRYQNFIKQSYASSNTKLWIKK